MSLSRSGRAPWPGQTPISEHTFKDCMKEHNNGTQEHGTEA